MCSKALKQPENSAAAPVFLVFVMFFLHLAHTFFGAACSNCCLAPGDDAAREDAAKPTVATALALPHACRSSL